MRIYQPQRGAPSSAPFAEVPKDAVDNMRKQLGRGPEMHLCGVLPPGCEDEGRGRVRAPKNRHAVPPPPHQVPYAYSHTMEIEKY